MNLEIHLVSALSICRSFLVIVPNRSLMIYTVLDIVRDLEMTRSVYGLHKEVNLDFCEVVEVSKTIYTNNEIENSKMYLPKI